MARLMFVDDDPDLVRIWRLLLEASGHEIESAGTVPQAIEKLALEDPDILLMDLRLPELKDGLMLLRKAGEMPSTRVVVLSGWPQDLESLPERKFVHRLLGKPVRPKTLLWHIAELMAGVTACYGIFLALL